MCILLIVKLITVTEKTTEENPHAPEKESVILHNVNNYQLGEFKFNYVATKLVCTCIKVLCAFGYVKNYLIKKRWECAHLNYCYSTLESTIK